METAPHLLRLVHEWILLRYLHPLDNVLLCQYLLISIGQLEHLVREPLLGALIFLQVDDVLLVAEEFR